MYGSQATRKKVYAGKCTNFFKNLSVAEFVVEAVEALEEGQQCLLTGETTGAIELTLQGLRDTNGHPAKRVPQGEFFSLKTDQLIRRGDKLFLWQSEN